MNDPYNLARYVEAQNRGGSYRLALAEIELGRKESHWIWFVFPQLAGLASSPMSRQYAIASLQEAVAYLQDPVLGARLREITGAVQRHVSRSARDIFFQDDVKFHSSMTLFTRADSGGSLFQSALEQFFKGSPDSKTLALLDRGTALSAVEG